MAKQKEERNQAIWKDFEAGMSRNEICQKFHMKMEGLKSQIRRMRERKGLLGDTSKQKKRPSVKVTSTQTSASTSTKRMTFWLPGDMIEKIKTKAAEEGQTASQLARELFSKYLLVIF